MAAFGQRAQWLGIEINQDLPLSQTCPSHRCPDPVRWLAPAVLGVHWPAWLSLTREPFWWQSSAAQASTFHPSCCWSRSRWRQAGEWTLAQGPGGDDVNEPRPTKCQLHKRQLNPYSQAGSDTCPLMVVSTCLTSPWPLKMVTCQDY